MQKTHLNYLIAVCAITAIAANVLHLKLAFVILKPLTTILIILLLFLYRADNASKVVTITAIALIACLVGDVFLLEEKYFVYGLSAFLLAHLLFIFVFLKLSRGRFYLLPLIILLIFGGISYSQLFPQLGELAIPVAVYTACILLMCWQGVSVYLSRPDQVGRGIAIAAVLFVFSDSIISVNKFLYPFELSTVVILLTYWASIAIIANLASEPLFSEGT